MNCFSTASKYWWGCSIWWLLEYTSRIFDSLKGSQKDLDNLCTSSQSFWCCFHHLIISSFKLICLQSTYQREVPIRGQYLKHKQFHICSLWLLKHCWYSLLQTLTLYFLSLEYDHCLRVLKFCYHRAPCSDFQSKLHRLGHLMWSRCDV